MYFPSIWWWFGERPLHGAMLGPQPQPLWPRTKQPTKQQSNQPISQPSHLQGILCTLFIQRLSKKKQRHPPKRTISTHCPSGVEEAAAGVRVLNQGATEQQPPPPPRPPVYKLVKKPTEHISCMYRTGSYISPYIHHNRTIILVKQKYAKSRLNLLDGSFKAGA